MSAGRLGRTSSVNATIFSWFLFIYLGCCISAFPLQEFVLFVCCVLCVCAPIQSTLCQQQSHTCTHSSGHTTPPSDSTHRGTCVPLRLIRPLPAARTHIVSHRRPLRLIPSDWPPGSPAFSETSSHVLFLPAPGFNLLLSIYGSLYLLLHASVY